MEANFHFCTVRTTKERKSNVAYVVMRLKARTKHSKNWSSGYVDNPSTCTPADISVDQNEDVLNNRDVNTTEDLQLEIIGDEAPVSFALLTLLEDAHLHIAMETIEN